MTREDLIIQEQRRLLEAAIADIPHVGKFCKHIDGRGYCKHTNQVCCKQVHTVCNEWEWRGTPKGGLP